MSTIHEQPAGLPTVTEHLATLAGRLRHSDLRVPEVSAAHDAITCAAFLLRTQQDRDDATDHMDLLHEAIGLARSVVETTKYACRARAGGQPTSNSAPRSAPSLRTGQGTQEAEKRD
jgi:hypothetical protein